MKRRLDTGKRRVSRRQSMLLDFLVDRQPDAVVMPRDAGSAIPPRHVAGCICEPQSTAGLFERLFPDCPVHGPELEAARAPRERPQKPDPGEHLAVAVSAAVPLWIMEMRQMPADERIALGHGLAQIVAEKSDVLMFGGGKKGEVREIFNALARGLAALAYQPGGVTFAGMHFEATDAP